MNLELKWYRDGLQFSCTQCGNCCSGSGVVWVNIDEMERLAESLSMSRAEFARKYVRQLGDRYSLIDKGPHGDCVFLGENRRCTLYEHRPVQCRTWPFWPMNLTSSRNWRLASQRCPGMGRGRLYSVEEIEQVCRVHKEVHIDF